QLSSGPPPWRDGVRECHFGGRRARAGGGDSFPGGPRKRMGLRKDSPGHGLGSFVSGPLGHPSRGEHQRFDPTCPIGSTGPATGRGPTTRQEKLWLPLQRLPTGKGGTHVPAV